MTESSTPQSFSGLLVTCDLAAHAWLMASGDLIAEWRLNPGQGLRLGPSLLRNADEQTVVGLAAVCQALQGQGLNGIALTEWGVVAAPRLLGRQLMVSAVQRFVAEGAWAISPNLIPHRSLHSLSGTISQALKVHGPNFGAGSAREALYCAAGLLASQSVPGVLIVITGWEPEPYVQEGGIVPAGSSCAALALVAMPTRADRHCMRLMIRAGRASPDEPVGVPLDPPRLRQLLEQAGAGAMSATRVVQVLDDGGRIELTGAVPVETAAPVRVPANGIHAGAKALLAPEAAK